MELIYCFLKDGKDGDALGTVDDVMIVLDVLATVDDCNDCT